MIIKKLRDTREDNDKTQKNIADILKIDSTTVSGWETGKDTIPIKKLVEYCNYFHYSLDYMFGLSKHNHYTGEIKINLKIIGFHLKQIRLNHNLTQKEMADFLNTTHTLIGYYERGIRLINTSFLYALAVKYNFSIDKLFQTSDQKVTN